MVPWRADVNDAGGYWMSAIFYAFRTDIYSSLCRFFGHHGVVRCDSNVLSRQPRPHGLSCLSLDERPWERGSFPASFVYRSQKATLLQTWHSLFSAKIEHLMHIGISHSKQVYLDAPKHWSTGGFDLRTSSKNWPNEILKTSLQRLCRTT